MDVAAWHAVASLNQRHDMWLLMSEIFVADAQKTKEAQVRFAAAVRLSRAATHLPALYAAESRDSVWRTTSCDGAESA